MLTRNNIRLLSTAGLISLLILAACFMDCGVSHSAPASSEHSPSFRYIFAHRFLPSILHQNPQLALSLALSETRQKLLVEMWERCREFHPDLSPQSSTGMSVSGGGVEEGVAAALITMPAPEDTPEAYYACLIVRYSVDGDTLQASTVAYYTLEKSISLNLEGLLGSNKNAPTQQGNTEPTVIGAWTNGGSHVNYGSGPAPNSPDDFISAVFHLYFKPGDKNAPTAEPSR